MKRFRNILILVLCAVIISVAFSPKLSLYRKDKSIPRIEIAQGLDGKKNIDVYVTLPQIKKEIAPIVIEKFLSQTKVASAESDGLQLIDFKNNSVLTRYGFAKGDIIKEINGHRVKTTAEAIGICEILEKEIFGNRDEKEINVSLTRNDEDINMNFKIPEFVPEKVHYTMCLEKRTGR